MGFTAGSLFWVKVAAILAVRALFRRDDLGGAGTVGEVAGWLDDEVVLVLVEFVLDESLFCSLRRMRMMVHDGMRRRILG